MALYPSMMSSIATCVLPFPAQDLEGQPMLILALAAGLALLSYGAGWLISGASRLAAQLGVSPLVIGLTVVAYGTSAPELAVSVKAALAGQSDIALGNVVGSNICNVLLILGLSAAVAPLRVHRQLRVFDAPLMIGVSIMLLIFCSDARLTRYEGLVFLTLLLLYTFLAIYKAGQEKLRTLVPAEQAEPAAELTGGRIFRELLLIAAGLTALVLGSKFFVYGATELARILGISELIIGLTVVAVGTSLPELMTSVVAARRGENDIAVANIVGSNIFNIVGVLGASVTISPFGVAPQAIQVDIPVMLAVAVLCVPVFTDLRIRRWEGWWFLFCYLAYIVYLYLDAKRSPYEAAFVGWLWRLGLPLVMAYTALTVCQMSRRWRPAVTSSRNERG